MTRARGHRAHVEDDSLWGGNGDTMRPTDHCFWARRVARHCKLVREQAAIISVERTSWLMLRNAGMVSMAEAKYRSYMAAKREGVSLWIQMQSHWDTYQLALMHDEDDGVVT